jgi:predicted  nucleic acid-binding Zn-ribbon protein
MEDHYAELKAELAANETEHKSFKRRLDGCEEKLDKALNMQLVMERQSAAIENLGKGMGRVETKVNSIDSRVAELEREPGEKWKKISFEVLKYLVIALLGVAVGYVINAIGK